MKTGRWNLLEAVIIIELVYRYVPVFLKTMKEEEEL
jgi:hypothetical protein